MVTGSVSLLGGALGTLFSPVGLVAAALVAAAVLIGCCQCQQRTACNQQLARQYRMGLCQRRHLCDHTREPLCDRTQRPINQITDANTQPFPCAAE